MSDLTCSFKRLSIIDHPPGPFPKDIWAPGILEYCDCASIDCIMRTCRSFYSVVIENMPKHMIAPFVLYHPAKFSLLPLKGRVDPDLIKKVLCRMPLRLEQLSDFVQEMANKEQKVILEDVYANLFDSYYVYAPGSIPELPNVDRVKRIEVLEKIRNIANKEADMDKRELFKNISKVFAYQIAGLSFSVFDCNLRYMPKWCREDRDIVLKAVTTEGRSLEFASECFQGDKKVVKLAVRSFNYALVYAKDELKKDIYYILNELPNSCCLLGVDDSLRGNGDFMYQAFVKDKGALTWAKDELFNNKEFMHKVVAKDPDSIVRVGNTLLMQDVYLQELKKGYDIQQSRTDCCSIL